LFELVGFGIAILFLAVAAYFDIFNKRIVPDWLSYAFIVIALAFSLFTEGIVPLKIGVAVAVFALGYLIYRVGYVGGADVFFLSGLALLLPLMIEGTPTLIYILLISTIVMAVFLELQFFASGTAFKPRIEEKVTAAVWVAGYGVIAYMLYTLGLAELAAVAVLVGIISSVFALIKRDLSRSLITWVKPREIIEEDILAMDEMDKKIIDRLGLERLLTKEMIARLKKAKVAKVPVYGKLPPYLPFILLGVIGAFAASTVAAHHI